MTYSEKSQADSLSDILGILDLDLNLDLLDVVIGDNNTGNNNNNSNNGNTGNGGQTPPPSTPSIVNNYYGPVSYNYFTGPTYNFFPGWGGGSGGVPTPTFPNGTPYFNPIIIILPFGGQGNVYVININITIYNGPVSVASGAF
ncbi:MAG: hypothetical protein R3C11_09075 [Planctomycetaceae bacterium]